MLLWDCETYDLHQSHSLHHFQVDLIIIESLLFALMVPLLIVDEDRLLIMYDTVTRFFSNVELRKGWKLERGNVANWQQSLMNYPYIYCVRKKSLHPTSSSFPVELGGSGGAGLYISYREDPSRVSLLVPCCSASPGSSHLSQVSPELQLHPGQSPG